jgi:hypothetical protein
VGGEPQPQLPGDVEGIDVVVATLRAYLARSGAVRAAVLLDLGEDETPVLVDCDADGEVEVSAGDRAVSFADPVVSAQPLPLPPLTPAPPLRVDPDAGRVEGIGGGLDALAAGLRGLLAVLPGRSVATVEFATVDPDTPFALAARHGEPVVAALGDRELTL